MNMRERKKVAEEFSKRWIGRGNERKDSQSFWLDLLQNVYGIENPVEYITFEDSVQNMMDNTSFIDGYIEKTNILIEQKGSHRDLNKGIRQSDGSLLTPFQQAMRYSATLPYSKRPRWIITCNFKEFYIYDMEKPNSEPAIIKLENLKDEYYRLEILIEKTNTQIEKETKVSLQAGELVGEIYDELLKQYKDPNDPHSLESINQLSVRLVFCFYAEDAGLFGKKGMLHDYLDDFNERHFRNAIIDLFNVLNTKIEDRDPYLDEVLTKFPYVNGDLFKDMNVEIPHFTAHLRELILDNASNSFDWSEISPTIFGGVFESTLNPEQRRQGGMHYTSIENIHKVIDPLFLDNLKNELNEIKQLKQPATIRKKAQDFQKKLGNLTFLDPAAGSGNFLTETYLELRRLENEALQLYMNDNLVLDVGENLIKVKLDQFYGIEINDFAVSVAKTALWIAESQMFEETQNIIYSNMEFLPLESYTNIIEGNALEINWHDIVDKRDLNYIMGNPPFFGSNNLLLKQRKEINAVFAGYKGIGKLDYVAGWYMKAATYIQSTKIRCAFVSTNSITQGVQVADMWNPLLQDLNIKIDFAHRTFVWSSGALGEASVHCVIIGFSSSTTEVSKKVIYDNDIHEIVNHINPYLVDSPDILVSSRRSPISNVKELTVGSRPNDGGNLMLNQEEYNYFIKQEPESQQFLKRAISGGDFINNKVRYCLWLKDIKPNQLRNMPLTKSKIQAVKEYRLEEKKPEKTKKLAATPHLFEADRKLTSNFLFIPQLSSHNRKYIPMGFLTPDYVTLDPHFSLADATMYEFGILTSNVHMAWMRAFSGRFKSDYRYSNTIIYNTFPWPEANKEDIAKISETAKAILGARNLYPESSLADLYDELTMPVELRKAHQENDRAVMRAYGMKVGKVTEKDSLTILLNRYSLLLKN